MTMMEVEVNRYTAASTTTTQPVVEAPSSAAGISREQLQIYYARLFPFELLHQWLSYTPPKTEPKTNNNHGTLLENNNNNSDIINNNTVHSTTKKSTASKLFAHREFSMTIETAGGDEVYIRYQSFHSAADLAAAVVKRRPIKLDIGAIFSHPPVNHECVVPKSAFSPVARELVFDIDLTDYDGVRHCGCSGASICKTCWQFMDMAIAVVDPGLRRDFGFAHIQWFYSGRRGVHCWVCDDRARELTDAGRSAVANYFNVRTTTISEL